ncbi:hypothetical protein [Parvularcula maris]|uniref:Uncharacterized protein n=1 Tax=Parvularcula maris TaxID=2965077 RepID=A0A9X2L9F9_9PROT|nr:hypothetical protein [Parvularcula maris]MCQ8185411.1 hypothetical protein [Parvularcula maris]
MLLTTAIAALTLAAPAYEVEVMVQEKKGLFGSQSVRVSRITPLEEGPFEIGTNAGDPMLEGTIAIDGGVAEIQMTVCRPKTSPCDPVGEPSILFRVGSSAEIEERTLSVVWSVSFEPE